jgi:hypothetical protein
MQNNPQRETVIYRPVIFKGLAYQQYEKDLKRRQKEGWQLVICQPSGPIMTAIYERGAPAAPVFDLPNLAVLLSTLSPQERGSFESEVQAVVNRWLARKTQG